MCNAFLANAPSIHKWAPHSLLDNARGNFDYCCIHVLGSPTITGSLGICPLYSLQKTCQLLLTKAKPISLLSLVFRMLERILLNHLSGTIYNLLPHEQAGFRKNCSTADQVLALLFIVNGFQERLKTGVIFLDLTATYDTIWHSTLNIAKPSSSSSLMICKDHTDEP